MHIALFFLALISFLGVAVWYQANPSGDSSLVRRSECGAILVVGGGGWQNAQRGIESDQQGMNIASFECRYYLAVNDKMQSNVGTPRARAFADGFSRDITMEGELVGDLGFSIATVCEVSNDIDLFGDGAGDVFFDEGTDRQTRGGWRTVSCRLSSDPEVVIAP